MAISVDGLITEIEDLKAKRVAIDDQIFEKSRELRATLKELGVSDVVEDGQKAQSNSKGRGQSSKRYELKFSDTKEPVLDAKGEALVYKRIVTVLTNKVLALTGGKSTVLVDSDGKTVKSFGKATKS